MKKFAAACAAFILLAGCASTQPQTDGHKETFLTLDTVIDITAYGENGEAGIRSAKDTISHYEKLFSVTDENSDITKVNSGAGGRVKVDLTTAALVFWAQELCGITGGALDISVYPVVRAWGFTTPEYRVPEPQELSVALGKVGYDRIYVDNIESTVTVPDGMQLDLGAAAKGYIGDRAIGVLRETGVESAILNIGGGVQTLGTRPDGTLWRIAVRDPLDPGGEFLGIVKHGEGAVVSSGGYERYFEADGKTYHHIIDPATGYPADSGLLSVTVVGGEGEWSGFYSDGLSTALFVMGRGAALDFWQKYDGTLNGMDFELILVTDSGEIVITEGLRDSFELFAGDKYILTVEERTP